MKGFQFRLKDRFWLLISLPLVFELVFISMLGFMQWQTEGLAQDTSHSMRVLMEVNGINRDLYALGTTGSGVRANQGDINGGAWTPVIELTHDIDGRIERLKALAKDDEGGQQEVAHIKDLIAEGKQMLAGTMAKPSSLTEEYLLKEQPIRILNRIIAELSDISDTQETVVAIHHAKWDAARQSEIRLIVTGVAGSVLLCIWVARQMYLSVLSRLQKISINARNYSERKPLLAKLDGADEISEVDSSFHAMAEQLERAEASKTEFLSMIAHDLRSPLASQQFFLQALATKQYSHRPEIAEQKAAILAGDLDRLLALITNLLDIQRFDAGKMKLSIEPVSLFECINRARNALDSFISAKNISLNTQYCVSEGVFVWADANRLVQVLVNLLSNAVKFSPDGGKITLALSKDPGWWRLSISDEGPGIPPGERETIFNRFEQLPGGEHRGGSGLGLSLAQSIIEELGGNVEVDEVKPHGSCFSITLRDSSEELED